MDHLEANTLEFRNTFIYRSFGYLFALLLIAGLVWSLVQQPFEPAYVVAMLCTIAIALLWLRKMVSKDVFMTISNEALWHKDLSDEIVPWTNIKSVSAMVGGKFDQLVWLELKSPVSTPHRSGAVYSLEQTLNRHLPRRWQFATPQSWKEMYLPIYGAAWSCTHIASEIRKHLADVSGTNPTS